MRISNKSLVRWYSPKIDFIKGDSIRWNNSHEVELWGLKIKGISKDLPNLIFFVDWFDKVENWIPFFT